MNEGAEQRAQAISEVRVALADLVKRSAGRERLHNHRRPGSDRTDHARAGWRRCAYRFARCAFARSCETAAAGAAAAPLRA